MRNSKMMFVLLFVAVGIIASFGVGALLFNQYNKFIEDSYKARLESAVRLIKNQFPQFEDIATIERNTHNRSREFFELNERLRVITDSIPLRFAYYLKKNGNNYEFLLFSHFDIEADTGENTQWTFDKTYINRACATLKTEVSNPYTDETDTTVSAFLPVVSGGNIVGVIGIDQNIHTIESFQTQAQITLLIAIIVAVIISLVISLIAAGVIFKEPDEFFAKP